MNKGVIYLVPCPIGDNSPATVLPKHTLEIIQSLEYFIRVGRSYTYLAFVSSLGAKPFKQ